MNPTVALKAAAVQALAVGLLFAGLVAAPLPAGFFRDAGALVGPLAWIACALLTGRLLSLPRRAVVLGAVGGGAAGAALTLGGAHTAGMVTAVVAFGVVSGTLVGRGEGGRRGPVGGSI